MHPRDQPFDVPLDELRVRQSYKWRHFPPEILPTFIAEMDFGLAPPVHEALRSAIARSDTGYTSTVADLADAFVGFASARFGWQVDATQVCAVTDVVVGIVETLRCLTRPGEGVIVNTPAYGPFFTAIPEAGCRVVVAPLATREGRFELDLDAVEAAMAQGARTWLLCNPHNPTGRVFSRTELEQALTLAARYEALIIVDEVHAPLTMSSAQHIPLLSLDGAGDRAVVLTSASKAFNICGLKCALVVTGGSRLAQAMRRMPAEMALRTGHLGVLAAIAAYRDGGPWLDDLLSVLTSNCRLLEGLLDAQLPEVRFAPPEGTYLAWLDLGALDLGPDASRTLLKRGALAVASGAEFGAPKHFVRIVTATSPGILTEIVRRIAVASGRISGVRG